MTPDFKKILVLALAGAGDALMATPFLKELRLAFPQAQIDVLVLQGPVARAVLEGNPNINNLMLHNFVAESPWRSVQFCLRLRRERYDASFSLMPQNRFAYNFVAWLIGARERIGFDYAVNCGALSRWLLTRCIREDEAQHLVDNDLRLLSEALDLPLRTDTHHLELVIGDNNRDFASQFIQTHHLEHKRLIGFHPGSGTTKNLILRRWAPERWAELARRLVTEDEQTVILLFGAAEEQVLRDNIRSQSGLAPNRLLNVGRLELKQAAALIGRLNIFICCDTLLTHIAAAMNTPTVEILGPTPAASIYPYGVPHRIVRLDLWCSPCYRYARHGIRCVNPIYLQCLKELTPQMAADAIRKLTNGSDNKLNGAGSSTAHQN